MYDILFQNVQVADGTSAPCYRADVALSGSRIVKIAPSIKDAAVQVIDGTGKVLCPGFMDAHGHSDFTLFLNNRGESKIHQGITTEVTGNCGFTPGPIRKEREEDVLHYLANTIVLTREQKEIWKWQTQDAYLREVSREGLSFHVVPLVGQGMIHVGVMGFEDRMPTEEELEIMKQMLRKELDAGFFGMSMAFEYEPGNYIHPEEVTEMCRVLKDYGGIYTIHMRNEGKELLECVQHAISIARDSGCRVEISHMKARFAHNWGKAREAMELITQAREEGVDIAFDVYPYAAYGSGLIDLIPPWVKKNGPKEMIRLLQLPGLRERVIKDMQEGLPDWDTILMGDGWENRVQIASLRTPENKCMEGKTVGQIAKKRGCTPYDVVVDLMISEEAAVKSIGFAMDEGELREIMCHPLTVFGTDGRACATYGILSQGAVHPRYYGTYPRILGKYVREEKLLSLEEAIHKSTGKVAERFGIAERGFVKEGYFADIVLFSPEEIAENNSFADPHHYPVGIDYVLVDGQIVIDHGEHTGALPGKILRKERL